MLETVLAIVGLVVAAIGSAIKWASMSDAARQRLSELGATVTKGLKRGVWWVLKLLALFACVAVVWDSLSAIYAFVASDETITRKEVLRLLLSAFNLVMYAIAAFVLLCLVIPRRHRSDLGTVTRNEGESLWVVVDANRMVKLTLSKVDGKQVTVCLGSAQGVELHSSQPRLLSE